MIKNCSVCNKSFKTHRPYQNICSWDCRQEATRTTLRILMRIKRHSPSRWKPCEVCGFKETTDRHHEGKKIYTLCPNHHALITRGIKTIKELLVDKL